MEFEEFEQLTKRALVDDSVSRDSPLSAAKIKSKRAA
jgi:hypothetical protein